MQILKHRIDAISDIDQQFGIEIDIRDYNKEIVLAHDYPTKDSIKLTDFLKHVNHNALLAINIKSSQIENELHKIITESKIENYFTFDWSIPSLLKALTKKLICAFRISEYEKEIIPNCSWVWVDAFHSVWYDKNFLNSLKNMGLKLAIVSPELHNREFELDKVKEIVKDGIADAICTDLPQYWIK